MYVEVLSTVAVQGEDKAHRVRQYCGTGKRDIGDQGK